MTDRALTRVQAAERYGISERHLRHLEGEHQIPVLRLGRAVRYDAKALAALEHATRCPSKSLPEKTRERSGSPARSPAIASVSLRERLIAGLRKNVAQHVKPSSTVTPFTGRRQPRQA